MPYSPIGLKNPFRCRKGYTYQIVGLVPHDGRLSRQVKPPEKAHRRCGSRRPVRHGRAGSGCRTPTAGRRPTAPGPPGPRRGSSWARSGADADTPSTQPVRSHLTKRVAVSCPAGAVVGSPPTVTTHPCRPAGMRLPAASSLTNRSILGGREPPSTRLVAPDGTAPEAAGSCTRAGGGRPAGACRGGRRVPGPSKALTRRWSRDRYGASGETIPLPGPVSRPVYRRAVRMTPLGRPDARAVDEAPSSARSGSAPMRVGRVRHGPCSRIDDQPM